MAAENEEFEFRLRAEKEAAAKPATAPASKPAASPTTDSDLINQGVGGGEMLLHMGSSAIAKPASDIAGLAAVPLHAAGAIQTSPTEVKEKVQSAGTFKPETKTGKTMSEYNPIAMVGKLLGWAGGKARGAIEPAGKEGGVVAEGRRALGRGVEEAIQQSPVAGIGSFPRAGVKAPKVEPAPKPTGTGAEPAVNELQRQRNVASGIDKPADLAGQSAHEAAVLERDKVTTPMLQAAFRSGEKVDSAPVLKMVGDLEGKNPDPGVRAALKQVRAVIDNATKSAQGKSLPSAGARVTPAELKKMQGQAGTMDVAMADEVRQSIKGMIDGVGEKQLSKHTQEILGQLRDKLVEGAPESYRTYLSEYGRLSEPLEQFKAAGGARDKVTTDAKAFNLLNPADKQNMIQSAFKSDTPGRALSELVRDTAHSPEAAAGVREAYTAWLTQADPLTNQPTARGWATRWEQTRDAARSSKMMDDAHVADMDKFINDIRDAGQQNALRRGLATAGGWLFGSSVGHPILAAGAARDLVGGTAKAATDKAVGSAMMQIAADPKGAAALAAPPTPANIAKIRAMLPADLAATIAPTEARDEPPRRRSNPLSMQPRF